MYPQGLIVGRENNRTERTTTKTNYLQTSVASLQVVRKPVDVRKEILVRVYISFLCMLLLAVLILGWTAYIQRFEGKRWRSMSDSMHRRYVALPAVRGTIYSEDGQMLSISIPTFDIYFDFNAEGIREKNGKRFREHIDSFCMAMSSYFSDKPASVYKKELKKAYDRKLRYYPLKKKLSFDDYRQFRQFPLVRLGRNKSGVIVEVNSKRLMPFGMLASRTIGLSREYVNSQGAVKKQNVGIEKSYDSLLSGNDGRRLVRFIAGGAAVPVEGTQVEPENGKDIYTTIDLTIQDITEMALLKKMQECEGPYGTAIVMETNTGKIKAIANLGRRNDGSYAEDDNYALRTTEPGSTMKLVTLLAVLDKGSSSIDDVVEIGSAGRAQVGNKMVTDAERAPKAIMTVKECFSHSSNIGMSKLAYKAFAGKPDAFKEYLHRYWLDERIPVDLANVPKPSMAPLNEKGSSEGNLLWMSFGYGIQMSPLHTLMLYNAVANNGTMVKPYLVNSISRDGILARKFQPVVLEQQIAKPAVIRAARQAMEATVTDGTATRVMKGLPFSVAGKTGTAHVSDGAIKYSHNVYQASFVGYFPADKPRFTCIVVIRTRPGAVSHYGGTLAAPVFREIASRLYTLFVDRKSPSDFAANTDSSAFYYAGAADDVQQVYAGLQVELYKDTKNAGWAYVYRGNGNRPELKPVQIPANQMPDLRGMGLKDALWLLESKGIKVLVKGRGKVNRQSLAPGVALANGITVILELSS